MADILMQHGRSEYAALLDLTEERHRAYAARHGLEYTRFDGTYAPTRTGHWDAFWLMLNAFQENVEHIFWLDADTLIVCDDDPREAFTADVAMCRHPGPPWHWNCGVMFAHNTERVRDWLQAVWRRGPGVWPWYQQDIMNELVFLPRWLGLVERLPDAWNSTQILGPGEVPKILAWHGTQGGPEGKLAAMQAYMNGSGGDEPERE